jgi:uncharacterized protein
MLSRHELIRLLREEQPYLAAEFGVARIGLFGSYAGERHGEGSDIDLVVELERPLGFRFVELVEHLEHLLGSPVDVLTPAGIDNIRHDHVAKSIRQSIVYV